MLRFLRKYSSSVGVKILYGLLAALFVLWGVGAVGGERVDVVATVYDAPITRRELDTATIGLQRRYESMVRGVDVVRTFDLRGQALNELIEQALIAHEARRLGLIVSNAEVLDTVTRIPTFQENGRFSRERLQAALEDDRGEFEEDVRRTVLFHRLRTLVTDGVQVSDAEVEERYRFDHTPVNLTFARLEPGSVAAQVSLTDEDLERYLADHAERYRVPTRLRARYVAYRTADFAGQVTPTDGEIDEYYILHKDQRFTEPEQVRARHILVKVAPGADEAAKKTAREKAEALRAKAASGGDFAALARANSEDDGSKTEGGDLGLFPRGRMAPEFEAAAFALAPGEVSALVETPFGFHVIKVEEHRQGGTKPLETVRDDIVKVLKEDGGLEKARAAAEATSRAVVAGKSLADAAGTQPVAETLPFALDEDVPGVGREKGFTEAAFALTDGEVSDLVETEATIYLLTPFDRVEAHAPPLADVREKVEADARRDRAEALAKERAEKLLARAREIGLEKAASEAGAKVEETGPFDRRVGTIPKIGAVPELRTDAFALTPEAALGARVYTAAGDAFVVSLRERLPVDMAGFDGAKDALRESLLQQKRSAATEAYLDYLKKRAQQDGALTLRANALERG